MLARRALTSHELLTRLVRKGGSSEDAIAVVDELKLNGYLNDFEVAQDHIQRGMNSRLTGRFLLRNELRERGVEPDLIERLLDEEYPERCEIEIAQRFRDRKLSSYGELPLEKIKRRLAGSLNRRGFSGETIGIIIHDLDGSTF